MIESSDDELLALLSEFVGAFEIVFRYDWPYTRVMIGDERDGATFIEPGLSNEYDDWAARGELLEKYRKLIHIMQKHGIEPRFSDFLDRIPGFKGRVW